MGFGGSSCYAVRRPRKNYSSSFALRCALMCTVLFAAAVVRGVLKYADPDTHSDGFTRDMKMPVLLRKLLSSREPLYRPIPPKTFQENITVPSSQNASHKKKECTEPAYHEFPTDAFTQAQRDRGAIILHCIMVVYMFTALAIICDDYFVSSLQKICERLNLSEDVAGATFMAAGSSAPELFTSIIGVFIAKGDVGVGTIVGSAVFNILFVIGICAVLAGQVVRMTWWPLMRDSMFYSISVVALMCSIADKWITWYESLIMLLLYVVYIVFMRFNPRIQDWMYAHVHIFDSAMAAGDTSSILPQQPEKKFYGNYEIFDNDDEAGRSGPTPRRPEAVFMVDEHLVRNPPKKLSFEDACFRFQIRRRFRPLTRFSAACRIIISERQKLMQDPVFIKRQRLKHLSYDSESSSYTKAVRRYLTVDEDEEAHDDWIKIPSLDQGAWHIVKWVWLYPLRLLLYISIPDCRKKRWDRWWMATFCISIVWIAFFSYIMVWMVVLIGYTLGIPDSIMGITFLAAGTSVPDAMASVMVAKQGSGDMAVSNTIGSNVFDVLIGLALPWFLRTGLAFPGTSVYINSNGMIVSVILLFFTVILTICTIHLCGWRLDRRVGIVCLSSYAVFLLFAVLIEFNVFGYVNLPMCRE